MPLISTQNVDRLLKKHQLKVPVTVVDFRSAAGRVLREAVRTDRDIPPFDRSLMDGVAVRFFTFQNGRREFAVAGTQAAGHKPKQIRNDGQCLEIMTGAVIPRGCDTVIPIENVRIMNNTAIVKKGASVQKGDCLVRKGELHKKGVTVLKPGSILLAPQIALLASVGKTRVKVAKLPKVAVFSTGDEIVPATRKKISPHQIRRSNTYFMQTVLETNRLAEVTGYVIKDDLREILKSLRRALKTHDGMIFSGGISKGKYDLIPGCLKKLGFRVIFHGVSQKPGKPMLFARKGKHVAFGLPGNPISTQMTMTRYVLPYFRRALGLDKKAFSYGRLSRRYRKKTALTYFLPVETNVSATGDVTARPKTMKGSGDFVCTATAHGLMELPGPKKNFPKGFRGRIYHF